jgi:hypothetical protein
MKARITRPLDVTFTIVKRFLPIGASLALAGCVSAPPKASIPPLTQGTAAELLHYSTRAQDWIATVKKLNSPVCEYRLDLPDQTTSPTEIDLDHIVVCGGSPAPRQYDASVSFVYDTESKHWIIMRFSS